MTEPAHSPAFKDRRIKRLLTLAVSVGLALWVILSAPTSDSPERSDQSRSDRAAAVEEDGDNLAQGARRIGQAFNARESGVWASAEGQVTRILSDDLEGDRHQRFIVRVSDDQTILISHNIDLAPRVPGLEVGETLAFRGRYEWNEQGGVVHWTHHDPSGDREGGWILRNGERYRE